MSMDIISSKTQWFKIISSGAFLGKTLGDIMSNLGKRALSDLAVPFAKDDFPNLATKAISHLLDKCETKISGESVVSLGKWFILFISNDDMDDIIKVLKLVKKADY